MEQVGNGSEPVPKEANPRSVSFSPDASLSDHDSNNIHLNDPDQLAALPKRSRVTSNLSTLSTLPSLLVELYDLRHVENHDVSNAEWVQLGRWIKYEEDVEGVDARFGRPRVPVLSYHSLQLLNKYLPKAVFLLDLDADTFGDITMAITESFAQKFDMKEKRANAFMDTFRKDLKRIPGGRTDMRKCSLAEISVTNRKQSAFLEAIVESATSSESSLNISREDTPQRKAGTRETKQSLSSVTSPHHDNQQQRKISKRQQIAKKLSVVSGDSRKKTIDYIQEGAEACQVFAGIVPELRDMRLGMARLSKPIIVPQCVDAIPIRFVYIIVGPPMPDVHYSDVGRAVATLMANPAFQEVAYTAMDKTALLRGLQEFLDSSVVIPPGDIYKNDLINVDDVRKALRNRKLQKNSLRRQKKESVFAIDQMRKASEALETGQQQTTKEKIELAKKVDTIDLGRPWERTRKPFGGLINDFKRRFPLYFSDVKDAFNVQCISSIIFMFFVAFAPAISFGQVMNQRTDGYMGITEVFIAQCVCGIVWALFAGQPLLIQAATGPFLVFESALYQFCKSSNLEFLPMRVWVSFWTFMISIVIVMAEGSFLVGCVTRFTEDIFTCLIAGIFIYEAGKFVVGTFNTNPLLPLTEYCSTPGNVHTLANFTLTDNHTNATSTIIRDQPDTAMVSMVLVICTFLLAFILKKIRTSHYFGRTIRKTLGDFGVPITILIMVLIANFGFADTFLEYVNMPSSFGLTSPQKRDWFINPMGDKKSTPPWIIGGAIIPALLISILLFAEIEIIELLLTSKERGLKKPMGFHWDLMFCGGLMLLVSLFGLPWMCAAAVQSITHATSLTVMKKTAPGEKPSVDYVVEQRVTTMVVAILIGACSFLGDVLKNIPIAVLLGVFLYLGVSCLLSVQFVHRLILLFIPRKYFPDISYCKQVSMWRLHAYTLCQLIGFVALWTVNTIQQSSMAFPFVIALDALARRFLLPRLFSAMELQALDASDRDTPREVDEDDDDIYDEIPLPM